MPFAEGTIGRAVLLLAQQRGLRSKHKSAEMPKSRYFSPKPDIVIVKDGLEVLGVSSYRSVFTFS